MWVVGVRQLVASHSSPDFMVLGRLHHPRACMCLVGDICCGCSLWAKLKNGVAVYGPSRGLVMKPKTVVVVVLSVVAIALFWGPPLRFVVGGKEYILSGYPWVAPSYARTSILVMGGVLTAVFLGLSWFMVQLEKRMAELEEYPEEAGATGYYGAVPGAQGSSGVGGYGGSGASEPGGKEDEW